MSNQNTTDNNALMKFVGQGVYAVPDGETSIKRDIKHPFPYSFPKNTTVVVPKSVREIGDEAFMEMMQKLVILSPEITFPEGELSIFRWGGCPLGEMRVVAPFLPFAVLKQQGLALPAAYGFIMFSSYYDPKVAKEYVDYISRQKKRVLPFLFKNDAVEILKLLSDEKKITKKNIVTDYIIPAKEIEAVKSLEFLRQLDVYDPVAEMEKTEEHIAEKNSEKHVSDDYVIKNGVLVGYTGQEREIRIPEGVFEIGENALSQKDLHSVIIPNGVKSIGNFAFCGGNGDLVKVVLPETLESIGAHAFEYCQGLKDLAMPQHEIEIGEYAFFGCQSLADDRGFVIVGGILFGYFGTDSVIEIPERVKRIGWYAFRNNKVITEVRFLEGCTSIGLSAFERCTALQKLVLPNSLNVIEASAFSNCSSLKEINLPENIQRIDRYAFAGCLSLADVDMPVSLQEAEELFYGDSLSLTVRHWSPVISKAVKGCKLEKIYIDDIMEVPAKYRPIAAIGFVDKGDKSKDTERKKRYCDYLSNNASKLIDFAFSYPKLLYFLCERKLIKAKDLDAFMTEAEKQKNAELKALLLNYLNQIGTEIVTKEREKKEKTKEKYSEAVADRIASHDLSKGIEGLTFVVTGKLDSWPKVWNSRAEVKEYLENYGAYLGNSVNSKTDYLVTNDTDSGSEKNRKAVELGVRIITEKDFNDLIGKRFKDALQIIVPGWLKEIPDEAFIKCQSMTSVTIPDGVSSIGIRAFSGCKSLTSVTISKGVVNIADEAFKNCSGLTSITIPEATSSIGDGAFLGCKSLTEVTISGSVINIGKKAFQDCSSLTTLIIPSGITAICDWTFCGCGSLKNVVIPMGVTRIGSHAFYACRNIKSVTIPGSVKSIEWSAFSNCESLTNIAIPEGVTTIGEDVFEQCIKLKSVTIPESVIKLGKNAFFFCTSLEEILLGSGITSIDEYTFNRCRNLKNVKIPESVTQIRERAFLDCINLNEIYIPVTVKEIAEDAFLDCPIITIHAASGSYAEKYAKENNIPFVAE